MATIVELGINVAEFSEQQKVTISLFDQLIERVDTLNNKKVNVFTGGLTEFNVSMKETNELLIDISNKLNALDQISSRASSAFSKQAKSTDDTAIATRAYNSELDKVAKLEGRLSALEDERAQRAVKAALLIKQKKKDLEDLAKVENIQYQQSIANDQKKIEQNKLLKEAAESINSFNKDSAREEKERSEFKIALDKAEAKESLAIQDAVSKSEKQLSKEQEQRRIASIENAKAEAKEKAAIEEELNKRKKQLASEQKATEAASNDIANLRKSLKDKQTAYANILLSSGSDSKAAKAQLEDIKETQRYIDAIDNRLGKGEFSKLGKNLSEAFSVVRNIAYILPGIGIAGIFGLAFDAIGDVLSSLIETNKGFIELTKSSEEFNRSLEKQLDLIEQIAKNRDRLYSLEGISSKGQEKTIQALSSIGYSTDILDPAKIDKATAEFNEARGKLFELTKQTDEEAALEFARQKAIEANFQLDKSRNELKKISDYIKVVETFQVVEKIPASILSKFDVGQYKSLENAQAIKSKLESDISLQQKTFDQSLSAIDEFNAKKEEKENTEKQVSRKVSVETAAERIALNKKINEDIIAQNQKVLDSERSSDIERISAIQRIFNAKKSIINKQNEEFNSDIGNTGSAKEIRDKEDARRISDLEISKNQSIQRVKDDFAKRTLAATKEIYINELQATEKNNEEIYKNQEESLDKRLEAFGKYLENKRQQIQIEYNYERSLEQFSYKPPEEKALVGQKAQSGISQVNSLSTKGINEITSTYFDKRFSALKRDAIALRADTDAQKAFEISLSSLNDQFEKNQINLEKYTNLRKAAQQNYTIIKDKNEVTAAEEELRKTQDVRDEVTQRQLSNIATLKIAQLNADEQAVKDAEALQKNLQEQYEKSETAIAQAQKRVDDAKLKLQEDRLKTKVEAEQLSEQNIDQIRSQSFDLATTVADSFYSRQEELILRNIELVNKQYNNEINAIQKSTLAQKDKIALETQLKAQKDAKDREAEKKLRKEKHDAAVLDKEIAATEIIWSTQRAIAGALANSVVIGPVLAGKLALEFGIIGALALAKVIATPVPSYFLGTDFHPGGPAEFAEVAPEWIKEPNKEPYLATERTIKHLPRGTQVIPTYDIPDISEKKVDTWSQTLFLAKVIKDNNKQIKNIIRPNINVDLSFEVYKNKILHG